MDGERAVQQQVEIIRRVPRPGDHYHGLALDPVHRLTFVVCDGNDWHCAVDGVLTALPAGEPVPAGAEQFWLRRDPRGPWLIDLLAWFRIENGRYVSKRDQRIRMPAERALRRHPSGVRYLALEIALHYKAKYLRETPTGVPEGLRLAAGRSNPGKKPVRDAMLGWTSVALEDGRNIPQPRALGTYSGKFIVRVPSSLHADLVRTAAREGVSLNQYRCHNLGTLSRTG